MLGSDWVSGVAFAALGLAGSLLAVTVVKRTGIVDRPDEARKT